MVRLDLRSRSRGRCLLRDLLDSDSDTDDDKVANLDADVVLFIGSESIDCVVSNDRFLFRI